MRAHTLNLLVVALLCYPLPVHAQNSRATGRHGVVVDESGGAVHGAHVTVHSTHGTALQNGTTAPDGTFTIDPLPPGSYWLKVAASQFQEYRSSIDLDGPDRSVAPPLRIVLSLAPLQSDVTVTAQRGCDR